MSLFQSPSPLVYAGNQPNVEVQQRWYQPQPVAPTQPTQASIDNNPYTNAVNELNTCPVQLKTDILNDPDYLAMQEQVHNLLLQHLFAQALPMVLQNQQYVFVLEKYFQTVKSLRTKHEGLQAERQKQAEVQQQELMKAQQQIQLIAQDPVIAKRIQELQKGEPPAKEPEVEPQIQPEPKKVTVKKGDN